MTKTSLVFEQIERDPQDGSATWEIRLETDGITEIVSQLDKDTAWCGDGYRADCYSVTIERDQWEDSRDEQFQVNNVWNKGSGYETARKAMAAAKRWAKEQLKEAL